MSILNNKIEHLKRSGFFDVAAVLFITCVLAISAIVGFGYLMYLSFIYLPVLLLGIVPLTIWACYHISKMEHPEETLDNIAPTTAEKKFEPLKDENGVIDCVSVDKYEVCRGW